MYYFPAASTFAVASVTHACVSAWACPRWGVFVFALHQHRLRYLAAQSCQLQGVFETHDAPQAHLRAQRGVHLLRWSTFNVKRTAVVRLTHSSSEVNSQQ